MILLEAKFINVKGSDIKTAGQLLLCNNSTYDAVYVEDSGENKLETDYIFFKTEEKEALYKKVGKLTLDDVATPLVLLREIAPVIGTLVHYDTTYITYTSQKPKWTGFTETKGPDSHAA